MSDWGISCAKCGHPSAYHGMTFCQVDAGGVDKKRCDGDGYAISVEVPADDTNHAVALERERIAAWLETSAPSVNPYRKPVKPHTHDESRRFIREAEVLQRAAQAIRSGAHWSQNERQNANLGSVPVSKNATTEA